MIVEYLKYPPDKQELKAILKLLGMKLNELIRKNEREYADWGLAKKELDMEDLVHLMVESPSLIEGPIEIINNKAILGRPPENVLRLL